MLPENFAKLNPDEKFHARYASWMGLGPENFSSPEAQATYVKNAQRYKDMIELKKTDRVPLLPVIGNYFANYAGITPYEVMYEYDKYEKAWKKFNRDFKLDYLVFSGAFNPGNVLDTLDYKVYHWPGHKIAKTMQFQTVEAEYMLADEYDQLIADPEGFYLRVVVPRSFGALGGLALLPSPYLLMELPMVPAYTIPWGTPPGIATLKALLQAAEQSMDYAMTSGRIDAEIRAELGYPSLPGGISKAPFDIIGDTLRGTRGIMLDKFRHPAKLLEAVERLTPIAVQMGVQTATGQNNPIVFIPLHKGADGFMSNDDFKKFYWPTLKGLILGLIKEGLTPWMFVEGGYNSRLDIIADPDIPAGRTYWVFDKSDMVEVHKRFKGWAAFAGNVPNSMLYTGTPEQVSDYVKWLIDNVAQDGGYALANGAVLDQAKPENLHAMLNTGLEYGRYT